MISKSEYVRWHYFLPAPNVLAFCAVNPNVLTRRIMHSKPLVWPLTQSIKGKFRSSCVKLFEKSFVINFSLSLSPSFFFFKFSSSCLKFRIDLILILAKRELESLALWSCGKYGIKGVKEYFCYL